MRSFTHYVTAGVRTSCDPWLWCCSSSGGCGTGAGTLISSPLSQPQWPASPSGAGGTVGAACSPDRGCCHTSPASPGCPCTCRAQDRTEGEHQSWLSFWSLIKKKKSVKWNRKMRDMSGRAEERLVHDGFKWGRLNTVTHYVVGAVQKVRLVRCCTQS